MRRFITFVVFSALFIVSILVSTSYLITGRLYQLDEAMELASLSLKAEPTFNITARLRLLRDRMNGDDSDITDLEFEARIQTLASGMSLYSEPVQEIPEKNTVTTKLYRGIGRIIGRSGAPGDIDRTFIPRLDEAYFWERNRHYEQALNCYAKLDTGSAVPAGTQEVLELHIAFCLTMTGDYDGAEARCRDLVENGIDPELRRSAGRLLEFVDELRFRLANSGGANQVDLGRELFLNVNYSEAIFVLERFLADETNPDRYSEARYYKGRSHEELGQTVPAIEEFQRVIALGGEGPWSRKAHRRLEILKSFYDLSGDENELLSFVESDPTDTEIRKIVETFSPLFTREDRFVEPDTTETSTVPHSTGEIFVRTDPPGARISIDGRYIGMSPVFIPDLEYGSVVVKAEIDDRVEVRELNIGDIGIVPLTIVFVQRRNEIEPRSKESELQKPGAIEIDSKWNDLEIYLEVGDLGPEGRNIANVPPGTHRLIVIGTSLEGDPMFWEDYVEVSPGESTVVSVP